MAYEFPGVYGGTVRLSFDPYDREEAGYVLVFAYYRGKLVFVEHNKRGWELPGGTREHGEWEITAALRETYEESGAIIDGIEWIGQYSIQDQNSRPFIKSVYIARVLEFKELPEGFETINVKVIDPPSPEQIKQDGTYSQILKDAVYQYVLEDIQKRNHKFTKKTPTFS